MRWKILKRLPTGPGRPSDTAAYLKAVDDTYVRDAYHFNKREDFMHALECGSVEQNIEPFALFLGHLVSDGS